jgi:hypothetical protein
VGEPVRLRLNAARRAFAGVGSYLASSLDALRSVRAAPVPRGYVATVVLLDLAQYTSGMVIWLYLFARGNALP